MTLVSSLSHSGLHLSVIHGAKDLLDKLLYIVNKEPQLKPLIDEQNALYQVGTLKVMLFFFQYSPYPKPKLISAPMFSI